MTLTTPTRRQILTGIYPRVGGDSATGGKGKQESENKKEGNCYQFDKTHSIIYIVFSFYRRP